MKCSVQIQFTESGEIPLNKVSCIRGGIGEMLLCGNCPYAHQGGPGQEVVTDDCDECSFFNECVLQRIYYHPMKICPDFVQGKSSVGYYFECDDRETRIENGKKMEFSIALFGDVIIHFPQLLTAIYQLGMVGLGVNRLKYQLLSIKNHRGEYLVKGQNLFLNHLKPDYLGEMIANRIRQLESEGGIREQLRIRFDTPWTQKYQGEFIRDFVADAFSDAIYRRVYLINSFEGIKMERVNRFHGKMVISNASKNRKSVERFSNTYHGKIRLEGIIGTFDLERIPVDFIPYLLAGELLHVGKNITMGFGKYHVEINSIH